MPHLISNLYEKAYTPFTAKLAPRHLWSKPQLGMVHDSSDVWFRQKAPEDRQVRRWSHREGHLEIREKMDCPEPQALLHLRCPL